MTEEKKQAVQVQAESGFSLVDTSAGRQVLQTAFNEFGLTAADLSRVKMPAGGGIAWGG